MSNKKYPTSRLRALLRDRSTAELAEQAGLSSATVNNAVHQSTSGTTHAMLDRVWRVDRKKKPTTVDRLVTVHLACKKGSRPACGLTAKALGTTRCHVEKALRDGKVPKALAALLDSYEALAEPPRAEPTPNGGATLKDMLRNLAQRPEVAMADSVAERLEQLAASQARLEAKVNEIVGGLNGLSDGYDAIKSTVLAAAECEVNTNRKLDALLKEWGVTIP